MGGLRALSIACLSILGLTACEPEQFFSQLPSATLPGKSLVEASTAEGVVCNPLGGGGGTTPANGLKGDLYYGAQTNAYPSVLDYFRSGIHSGLKLYLDQVNVPTRAFSSGFVTTDGQLLVDQNRNVLIEYFGLSLESELTLSDGDPEGLYQLAILADDGARLRVFDLQSGGDEIINIDGTHPTRLGCPSRSVQMTRGHSVPIHIAYAQGPRYHLALMLLWRLEPPNSSEELCGATGNDLFFDSTQVPSAPQSHYLSLERRGWKVVRPQNFLMPRSERNPCARE